MEKVFNILDYFVMHVLKNIIAQHCFMGIQDYHLHVLNYQKIVKTKLTNINKKFT
jgi:hypothetical protein